MTKNRAKRKTHGTGSVLESRGSQSMTQLSLALWQNLQHKTVAQKKPETEEYKGRNQKNRSDRESSQTEWQKKDDASKRRDAVWSKEKGAMRGGGKNNFARYVTEGKEKGGREGGQTKESPFLRGAKCLQEKSKRDSPITDFTRSGI